MITSITGAIAGMTMLLLAAMLLEQRRPLKRAMRLPKRRHDSQMNRH